MRIIMISGSPRDESRSLELIERMKEYLPDDVTDVMQIREGADLKTAAIKASEYEAVILETPLYIDGLDENKTYSFEYDGRTITKSGAYLKNVGINIDAKKQYFNKTVIIKSID